MIIQLHHYIVLIDLFYIVNFMPEHNFCRFRHYSGKEGEYIYSFGENCVPTIWLTWFFDPPKIIVWAILTIIWISSHFIFQSSNLNPILFATTAWNCRSSCKWQNSIIVRLFFCIITVIQLHWYIVLFNLLYIIYFLLKHNLYIFNIYNRKEGNKGNIFGH